MGGIFFSLRPQIWKLIPPTLGFISSVFYYFFFSSETQNWGFLKLLRLTRIGRLLYAEYGYLEKALVYAKFI